MSTASCPLSLAFATTGAGWAEAKILIGADTFDFSISYLGHGIGDLIERIYYLSTDLGYDDYNLAAMEYGEADITSVLDGEEATRHWEQIPWKTTPVVWEGEPDFVRLIFERKVNLDPDFDVSVTLDVHQQENRKYEYTVRYRDLCYATAKAVTALLIEYGIVGFYESAWMPDINLRHFLKIKEIALNEPIKTCYDSKEPYMVHSSLEEELGLLLKPM